MKTKLFIFAALSSAAMLSADDWNRDLSENQNQQNAVYKETPRTIMDDEIAKDVHDVLAGNWLSSGYPNVSFDVNNGTVSLRGVVDTQDEKNKIEQSVKKIEGVKAVRSDITVGLKPAHHQKSKMLSMNNNNYKRSNEAATATMSKDSAATDQDRVINAKIREKIRQWNPKGYETLVIATRNGAVVITGTIDRVEDFQRINNDVKNIDGVKSVTNQASSKKY